MRNLCVVPAESSRAAYRFAAVILFDKGSSSVSSGSGPSRVEALATVEVCSSDTTG